MLRISHSINQTHIGASDVKTKRSHLQKASETKKLDSSVGSQSEDHPSPTPTLIYNTNWKYPIPLQKTQFSICVQV